MRELHQHIKHTMFAYPFRQLFCRNTIRLCDHEDVLSMDIVTEFMEVVENTRSIGSEWMDGTAAIFCIDRSIFEFIWFADIGNRIDTETTYALVTPEVANLCGFFAHFRICPVEIRLGCRKGMEVILPSFFTPCPCAATKDTAPVCRCTAIWFCITPDIPVRIWIRSVFL